MLFSQSIPDMVLENSAASKFVSVLDSLQEVKQGIISDAVRSFNPILCMNEKWLRKYLTDYGFSDIPKGFPVRVLQQLLLNADTIMRLRGSKLGLEFFLSVCSLGVATIDTSGLYKPLELVFLDSTNYGYITSNNSDSRLFLCDNNVLSESSQLLITLRSKYFDERHTTEADAIMRYLQAVIPTYIGFSNDLTISWSFQDRSKFYYHGLLNPQYINDTEVSSDFDPFVPIAGGTLGGLINKDGLVINRPIGEGVPIL